MDKIAVLIPCYNEEQTIKKVIEDFTKVLKNKYSVEDVKIYVYDNASSDKTADVARAAGAVVRCEKMRGKGNVVRRMFREIDAECYILVDGDDTYPAKHCPEMIDKVLAENCDMVVGDRLSSTYYTENKRPFHNFGNNLVRNIINFIFKADIQDIMSGYRAFSYQFVKTYAVVSNGFEIETDMTIHAIDKNLTVDNVVVEYRDRPAGSSSKLKTFSDGFKVLSTIVNLFKSYRPLMFFSCISLCLIVLALLFFIPVFVDYIQTGLVERFPTLIVCGFCVLTAVISWFSGLILSNINHKDKQDFELMLIRVNEHFRSITNDKK